MQLVSMGPTSVSRSNDRQRSFRTSNSGNSMDECAELSVLDHGDDKRWKVLAIKEITHEKLQTK